MVRTLLLAICACALVSVTDRSEARSIRHGYVAPCSVMDRHPCMPTFCSVFDRHPCVPEVQYPIGQDLRINVESAKTYAMPDQDLNTLADLYAAVRACWQPPPLDLARDGMQATVRFAFNRSGQLIAPPRPTYMSSDAPPETRQIYRGSIDAAFERCTPLTFTQGLAGAVAGRPIAVRYIENRTLEGQWQP
ncbi:MAG TPA: hypothetical protein VM867_08575 [Xanthobacteraceae bacterium]|nr:hypothetical protein [Xanthobacteraceae bacterium]